MNSKKISLHLNKNISLKNIDEIYKKFNITPLKNNKIDLVYIYIDYNDIHYSKKIKDEIETKAVLHKIEMNKILNALVPINPVGRTGIIGRGHLGKWGI